MDWLVCMAGRSDKKRDVAILQVLRHTGLRLRELCALCLDDIDLSRRKGSLTVRSVKRAHFRTIPLNADACHTLTVYLSVRSRNADDHRFIGQRGRSLSEWVASYLVAKYARRAGLEDVTPRT